MNRERHNALLYVACCAGADAVWDDKTCPTAALQINVVDGRLGGSVQVLRDRGQ